MLVGHAIDNPNELLNALANKLANGRRYAFYAAPRIVRIAVDRLVQGARLVQTTLGRSA